MREAPKQAWGLRMARTLERGENVPQWIPTARQHQQAGCQAFPRSEEARETQAVALNFTQPPYLASARRLCF